MFSNLFGKLKTEVNKFKYKHLKEFTWNFGGHVMHLIY